MSNRAHEIAEIVTRINQDLTLKNIRAFGRETVEDLMEDEPVDATYHFGEDDEFAAIPD